MDTKTLCLGVLSLGESTGYDIKKTFEQTFSHFFVAGFGSIYPALADLAREGLVECQEVAQERRPAKKVYRLTDAGHEALRAAMAVEEPRHKVRSEFMVLTFFSHLLTPERLNTVLDLRCRDMEQLLASVDEVRTCPALTPGMRFTAGFAEAVVSAGLEYIRNNRAEFEAAGNDKAEKAKENR